MGKVGWAAVAVVVAGAAAGGYALVAADDEGGGTDHLLITDQVRRRTLSDEVTLRGTLARVEQRKVNAAGDGRVSAVHVDDGATVSEGQAILSLDGRDAVAVSGELSFYRPLDVGADGADVAQLERILANAGFDPGPVDERYTEQTRAALGSWQAAHDYPGAAPEGDETITVSLTAASSAYRVGARATAAVVVGPPGADAPSVPVPVPSAGPGRARLRAPVLAAADGIIVLTIRSANATTVEGAPASFLVEADEAPNAAFDLVLAVTGAAAGDDVLLPTVPFVFPAGARVTTLTIPTRSDDRVEADEPLEVQLLDSTAYDVGFPAVASTTVVSDDVVEARVSGTATVAEGVGTTITVTLDQPAPTDLQLVLTATGTATIDRDYRSFDPVVRIPAGSSSGAVLLTTLTDSTAEPDERVVVSLSPAAGYRVGERSSATVTIAGDAATTLPTMQITAMSGRVTEGQPAQFAIGLSQPLADELEVFLTYDGTAVEHRDFSRAPGRLVLGPGQTALTVTVPTLDDDVVEHDRSLWVHVGPSPGYAISPQGAANVRIASEDVPELTLVGGGFLPEGAATSVTVVADQPVLEDTSVNYQLVGSAQSGVDYAPLTGTVLLLRGQTSVTVPVHTIDDGVTFRPTDMVVGSWPVRVGSVLVDEGQLVPAGAPLLSLTDDAFTVTLRAGASDRTSLAVGQQVTVTLSDGTEESPGTITSLDDTVTIDETTGDQTYEGEVEVAGDLGAADGAAVTIDVLLEERIDALTVPIAAVKQDGQGNDVVRVIDLAAGGTITEVVVTTGLSEGSYLEIVTGLDGDEVVVVEVDVGGDSPT